MDCRLPLLISLSSLIFLVLCGAKSVDPYKVLGVDRSASQREIQKAFHKLSLQYHPDKNKNKGAQEKFSEINNAYEILSDEEKRKNYDTYGDEKGQPGFQAGHPGGQDGYTFFTGGQQGQNRYFRSPNWENMAGPGGSQSYSFSFGGSGGDNPFKVDLGDVFSNLFGGVGGGGKFMSGPFGGSNGGAHTQSGSKRPSKNVKAVSSQFYKTEIVGKGMTWLLYSYKTSLEGFQNVESVVLDVATSFDGALRVGSLDCGVEQSLCKDIGISSSFPRIFVYSLRANGRSSLVEYTGELSVKKLKAFCQDHFPRISKRLELNQFEYSSPVDENLPTVLLLSTKKDTPAIWRVVSGLYHKRFIFYDVQVSDVSDSTLKKLGANELPAVVGWLSNGEKHILKQGITVKDLKSGVHDLSTLLDSFEKKNKKVAPSKTRKEQTGSWENQVPLLAASNFDAVCGDAAPVCIIGAFRSLKAKENLESILKMVSQKTLSRRQNSVFGLRDSVSYSLLDVTKQMSFLTALEKSGFKSVDKFLVAYKPRKGKFATFQNDISIEEVERFISSVLNGDVRFTKTRQKPVLK